MDLKKDDKVTQKDCENMFTRHCEPAILITQGFEHSNTSGTSHILSFVTAKELIKSLNAQGVAITCIFAVFPLLSLNVLIISFKGPYS